MRSRLVQEQHRRLRHQRSGQVEPPPHASRIGLDGPVGRLGQIEPVEELPGPGPGLLPAEVIQASDHVEVLEAGQVLVYGGVLTGETDQLADLRRILQHVDACHRGGALVGLDQGGENRHRGGLACPVRSEQGNDGPLPDRQVQTVEGHHLPVTLDQSGRLDDVCHS